MPTTTPPKIALVTGAARGIGAGIARRLAADGFFVWLNDYAQSAEPVVEEIEAAGGKASAVTADLGDVAQIAAMFARIRSAGSGLDVLVNNAGICPFLEWQDITEADWDRTHAVNLKGAFFATQAAAQMMVEGGRGGRIIAISSISAIKGGTIQTHYCPTKGGLISMMAAFAVCLGRHGITCNSLLPGTIETPLNEEYLSVPANRDPLVRSTCLGHLGRPDDVAGAASFLAGPDAGYITGATLLVDGGEFVKHL